MKPSYRRETAHQAILYAYSGNVRWRSFKVIDVDAHKLT